MTNKRTQVTLEADTNSFERAIRNFVGDRVTVSNPTITDYLEHYGSKKALATHYAETNGLKYDTARKQIERMMQKPNMKLKPETVSRLGRLQASDEDVVISLTGNWTYDGGQSWAYSTFANDANPFNASQMRDIINATLRDGNQAGIDKFMQYYGVEGFGIAGISPVFAKSGLSISIEKV